MQSDKKLIKSQVLFLRFFYVSFFPRAIPLTSPHSHMCRYIDALIPISTVRESLWDEWVLLYDRGLYLFHSTDMSIPVSPWMSIPSPRE